MLSAADGRLWEAKICGKTTNTTSTTTPPSQYLAAYQDVLSRAQNVASQAYQPYTKQQVANLTPSQQAAFGAVDSAQGTQAPFIAQAAQNIGGAPNQYNLANVQGYASGLANPYAGAVANASRGYNAGQVAQNTLSNPYANMIGGASSGINPGQYQQFAGATANPYAAAAPAAGYSINPGAVQNYGNVTANPYASALQQAGYGLNPGTFQNYGGVTSNPYAAALQQAGQSLNPTAMQNFAGATANQYIGGIQQAAGGINPNAVQNFAGVAANPYAATVANNMGGYSAGQLNNTTQQLMSPYTQNVVNATQANINENNAEQQQQVVGNAISQGAFGGDRSAIAQSELARQQALASQQTIAGINQAGYTQAQNQAAQMGQFNAGQGLQGATTLAGIGSTSAQLAAQLAQSQGQLGMQGATSAGQLGGQGQQLAAQLAQYQAQLGLQGTQGAGNLYGQGQQLASQLAQYQAQLGLQGTQGAGNLYAQGQQLAGNLATSQGQLGLQGILGAGNLYGQSQGLAGSLAQSQGQLGLQGALGLGNLAQQAQNTGAGITQGSANLGLLGASELGTLGAQSQGNALNLANMYSNSMLNSGTQMGNLGTTALNDALTGASAQMQSGSAQQAQNQNLLNAAMQQYQLAQQYPFQSTGWLSNIAQGIGSQAGGTTNATVPNGNLLSQVGGLGLTGLGLYNSGLLGSFGSGAAATGGGTAAAAAASGSSGPLGWIGSALGSLFAARGGRIERDDGGGAGGGSNGGDNSGDHGGGTSGNGSGAGGAHEGSGSQGGGGSPSGGMSHSNDVNSGFAQTGDYAPTGANFAPVNGGLVGDTGLTGRQYGIINAEQSLNPGMPSQGIAAQLGNFNYESGAAAGDLNPNAVNMIGAFGIAQDLSQPRQDALLGALGIAAGTPTFQLGMDPLRKDYNPNAGLLAGTMNAQLSANNADLTKNYPGVAAALMNPNATLAQDVNTFGNGFERPGKDAKGNVLGFNSGRFADAQNWNSAISAAGPHADANVTTSPATPLGSAASAASASDGIGGAVTLDSPQNSKVSWSAVPENSTLGLLGNAPMSRQSAVPHYATTAENLSFNPNAMQSGVPGQFGAGMNSNDATAMASNFQPNASGLASIGQSPSGIVPSGNQNYSYNNTQVQPSFSTVPSAIAGASPGISGAPQDSANDNTQMQQAAGDLTVPGGITGPPSALQGSAFLDAPTGRVGSALSWLAAHGGNYTPAGGASGSSVDPPGSNPKGLLASLSATPSAPAPPPGAAPLAPYIQPTPDQISFGLGSPATSPNDIQAMYRRALGLAAARGGRIERDDGGGAGGGSSGGDNSGDHGGGTSGNGSGAGGAHEGSGSQGGGGSPSGGSMGSPDGFSASQKGDIPPAPSDQPINFDISALQNEEKLSAALPRAYAPDHGAYRDIKQAVDQMSYGDTIANNGLPNETMYKSDNGSPPMNYDINGYSIPSNGYTPFGLLDTMAFKKQGENFYRGGRIGRDAGGILPYAQAPKLPYGGANPLTMNGEPYSKSGGLQLFNGNIPTVPVGQGIGFPRAAQMPTGDSTTDQINNLLQQYSQGKKVGSFARGGRAGGGANVGDQDAPTDDQNPDINADAGAAMQYAPTPSGSAPSMPPMDPAAGIAPSAPADQTQAPFAPSKQNAWLALAAAGLGMMASKSNQPLQALGEGGLQGINYLRQSQEQARQNAVAQSEITYRKATVGIEADKLLLQTRALQRQLNAASALAGMPPTDQTQGANQTPLSSTSAAAMPASPSPIGPIPSAAVAPTMLGQPMLAPVPGQPAPGAQVNDFDNPAALAQRARVMAANGDAEGAMKLLQLRDSALNRGLGSDSSGAVVPLPGILPSQQAIAAAKASGDASGKEIGSYQTVYTPDGVPMKVTGDTYRQIVQNGSGAINGQPVLTGDSPYFKPVVEDFKSYRDNAMKFESDYQQNKFSLSNVAKIYQNYTGGRGAEAIAELDSYAKQAGIEKVLPTNWQGTAAGFDAALKIATDQAFKNLSDSGATKAPATGLRESLLTAPRPDADPAARYLVIRNKMAALDYSHDMYQDFMNGPPRDPLRATIAFQNSHPYQPYVDAAAKAIPIPKSTSVQQIEQVAGSMPGQTTPGGVSSATAPGAVTPTQIPPTSKTWKGKTYDFQGGTADDYRNPQKWAPRQ